MNGDQKLVSWTMLCTFSSEVIIKYLDGRWMQITVACNQAGGRPNAWCIVFGDTNDLLPRNIPHREVIIMGASYTETTVDTLWLGHSTSGFVGYLKDLIITQGTNSFMWGTFC